jgi:hypothetical protein
MATRKHHKNTRKHHKNTRKTLARQKGGAPNCVWDLESDKVMITGDRQSLFIGKIVESFCRDEILKGFQKRDMQKREEMQKEKAMQKKAPSKYISKKSPPKHRSLIMSRHSSDKHKNILKTTSLDGYRNNKTQKIHARTLRKTEKRYNSSTLRRREKLRIIAEKMARGENILPSDLPSTEDVEADHIGQTLDGRREADGRDSETEEEKGKREKKKAADRAIHDKSLSNPYYTR